MDEPEPTESDAKEPVAETPSVIKPERSTRTETSVVEGIPDGKTERIASMRRELADLQQHLIQAQQRVATELQGRVEDAERLEALESVVQEHENDATRVAELETEVTDLRAQLTTATVKTEDFRHEIAARDAQIEEARRRHDELASRSSALDEAKALLKTRDTELATLTTERDIERALRTQLQGELEHHHTQHRDVSDQLEVQVTSLRDAKALLVTLTAEVAAAASERDALKTELEPMRRELDAARTKAHNVASQLLRLGQDLGDGVVTQPNTSEASPVVVKRTQPPPMPHARTAAPTAAPMEVETILEMTEVAKPAPPAPRSTSALFMFAGLIVGLAVAMVIMKWSGSSNADDGAQPPVAAPPSPAIHAKSVAPTTSGPPVPAFDGAPPITAPVPTTTTDGVIVLPASASGHRVFVDGKVVEVKGSRATVSCGSHEVRIGSSGTPRKLDIVCGGETALPEEPREK